MQTVYWEDSSRVTKTSTEETSCCSVSGTPTRLIEEPPLASEEHCQQFEVHRSQQQREAAMINDHLK